MRKMKSLALFVGLFGMMSIASCSKDACADVSCGNGTCDNGTCLCDAGYEGSNCSTEMRTKFLGTYYGTMTVGGITQTSAAKITTYNGNVMRVWLDTDLYMEITGSTSVSIPTQILNDGNDTYGVSGTGSLNSNSLQLAMTWTTQGQNIAVVFQGTK